MQRTARRHLRVFTLCATAGIAACEGGGETHYSDELPPLPMEVVEGQQPLVADYEIVGAIRTELFADEQVGRRGIGINSRRGVVTLSGTVHDAAAKRRAVERARSVPGVRAVIDRLEVGKPDLIELDRDEVAEAAPREAAP